jgi:hypothetical protein
MLCMGAMTIVCMEIVSNLIIFNPYRREKGSPLLRLFMLFI